MQQFRLEVVYVFYICKYISRGLFRQERGGRGLKRSFSILFQIRQSIFFLGFFVCFIVLAMKDGGICFEDGLIVIRKWCVIGEVSRYLRSFLCLVSEVFKFRGRVFLRQRFWGEGIRKVWFGSLEFKYFFLSFVWRMVVKG